QLLEWQRYLRYREWALPISAKELASLETVRSELKAAGVDALEGSGDPLLGVDAYSSSFLYRKLVDGRWRTVKLVNIPGKSDLERELTRVQEEARIEQLRRDAVSSSGEGVVLINEARLADGFHELGPLLQDQNNQVIGRGVLTTSREIENI